MPILVGSGSLGIVAFSAQASTTTGAANTSATTISGTVNTIQLMPANTTTTGLASGSALAMPIPGSGKLEGRRFQVRLAGVIVSITTSFTMRTDFYAVTGTTGLPALANQLTAGSYTKLTAGSASASLTQGAAPGNKYSFFSDLALYGDSISGTLNGTQTTAYNNVAAVDNAVALNTQLTSVTWGPAVTSTPAASTVYDPALFLVPAFTFSAVSGSSYVQIDSFYCYAD